MQISFGCCIKMVDGLADDHLGHIVRSPAEEGQLVAGIRELVHVVCMGVRLRAFSISRRIVENLHIVIRSLIIRSQDCISLNLSGFREHSAVSRRINPEFLVCRTDLIKVIHDIERHSVVNRSFS